MPYSKQHTPVFEPVILSRLDVSRAPTTHSGLRADYSLTLGREPGTNNTLRGTQLSTLMADIVGYKKSQREGRYRYKVEIFLDQHPDLREDAEEAARDPEIPLSAIWYGLRKAGYERTESSLKEWVKQYRDA